MLSILLNNNFVDWRLLIIRDFPNDIQSQQEISAWWNKRIFYWNFMRSKRNDRFWLNHFRILMNRSRIVWKTLCISHCRRVRPNLTDRWRVTDWRQNFRRKIGTIANQGVKQCIRREGSMRRGCDTYQLAKINSADIQRMEFDSGEDPTITNVLCTDDCWLYTVHAELLSFIFLCCCDVAIAFSIV